MWHSAQTEQRARAGLPDQLSWAQAAPLIGLLSGLSWAFVLGIALAIWSAF